MEKVKNVLERVVLNGDLNLDLFFLDFDFLLCDILFKIFCYVIILNVDYNDLKYLLNEIFVLFLLKELFVMGNQLKELLYIMVELKKLELFYLNENCLYEVFVFLVQLQYL